MTSAGGLEAEPPAESKNRAFFLGVRGKAREAESFLLFLHLSKGHISEVFCIQIQDTKGLKDQIKNS